jgi:hypothetical protein
MFNQLPNQLAVADVTGVGADIASAGVTPTPQPSEMAVQVNVSAFADPSAAGAMACIVQTRRTGSSTWINLTSSRNNEITGTGTFGINIVDPILDDVRVYFDVTGHTFTAAVVFSADSDLTAAS